MQLILTGCYYAERKYIHVHYLLSTAKMTLLSVLVKYLFSCLRFWFYKWTNLSYCVCKSPYKTLVGLRKLSRLWTQKYFWLLINSCFFRGEIRQPETCLCLQPKNSQASTNIGPSDLPLYNNLPFRLPTSSWIVWACSNRLDFSKTQLVLS